MALALAALVGLALAFDTAGSARPKTFPAAVPAGAATATASATAVGPPEPEATPLKPPPEPLAATLGLFLVLLLLLLLLLSSFQALQWHPSIPPQLGY